MKDSGIMKKSTMTNMTRFTMNTAALQKDPSWLGAL